MCNKHFTFWGKVGSGFPNHTRPKEGISNFGKIISVFRCKVLATIYLYCHVGLSKPENQGKGRATSSKKKGGALKYSLLFKYTWTVKMMCLLSRIV